MLFIVRLGTIIEKRKRLIGLVIGEKIKYLRTKEKITQKELANQLHVSGQAVSNWERGKGYPDITNILHLSELFHLSVDELLKEDIEFKEQLMKEKKQQRLVDDLITMLVGFTLAGLGIFIGNWLGTTVIIIGILIIGQGTDLLEWIREERKQ